ncbi:MAG: DUF756 domain-containing protein, partial [Nocardia sp.]|nr:DUF756 domain-containing protein [Nocardia sp.]
LPKVSWLVPPATFSEHPSASTPAGSADLIYRLLDVVASDLETWSKTAIFLTFDENDGYFDHIAPPVAPRPASGNDQDWYEGKAIGLGARVPMTVISPWTIGGYIDSEIFDHTSVLRFLELCTGVREPNISSWRRTVCGDMTSAFDFGNAGAPPRAHHPGPIPAPVGRWKPNPPDQQSIPRQEPGTRPTRPLPYQPAAGATLTGSTLSLRLRNSGTSSAHFTVYPFHSPDSAPRHIDVRDCATVEFEVGDGYDLVVQGPNRFWHELRAAMSGPASGVEVDTEPSDSGLTLVLANRGARTITVAIAPLDFDGAAQQVDMPANSSRTLPWPVRGGWYDLEITAPADPAFRQRATGRVENGRPGITPDHGRTRDRGAAAVAASARLLTGS